MSKFVFTFDEQTKVVTSLKMVGDDCPMSLYCRVLQEYDPSVLGKVFDEATNVFLPAPIEPAA